MGDDVAEQATVDAFKIGYRHVDTALGYRNQVGVGKGLKKVGLDRDQFFVTSKIPGGTNANTTRANWTKQWNSCSWIMLTSCLCTSQPLGVVRVVLLRAKRNGWPWRSGQRKEKQRPLVFPIIARDTWKTSSRWPPCQLH